MLKNVGTIDKVLRIIVGLVLIGYATIMPNTGYNVWGWIGIIPLGTALIGICPLYSIFGIKTCSAPDTSDASDA